MRPIDAIHKNFRNQSCLALEIEKEVSYMVKIWPLNSPFIFINIYHG